jgi:hypothetical protein
MEKRSEPSASRSSVVVKVDLPNKVVEDFLRLIREWDRRTPDCDFSIQIDSGDAADAAAAMLKRLGFDTILKIPKAPNIG